MAKIKEKYQKQEYNDVIDEGMRIELDENDIPYELEVPASELGLHLDEWLSKGKIKELGCNKRIHKVPFKSSVVDIKKGDVDIYATYINKAEIVSRQNGKVFTSNGGVGEILQAKDIKHWLRDDVDKLCQQMYKKVN
jgi:hypothetical protein